MDRSKAILGDIFQTPILLGSFPFDKTFRMSKMLFAYCCCIRLLSVSCSVCYFLDPAMVEEEIRFSPKTNHSFRAIRAVFISVNQVVCIYWWVRKRERVFMLMDAIRQMILHIPQDKLPRARLRYGDVLLITFLILMAVSMYTYRYSNPWHGLREYLNGFINVTNTISFIGQFWDIQNLLRVLLRESTRILNRDSIEAYDFFCDIYKTVNEIYNPQIFMTVTFNFFLVVYNLYVLMLPVYPNKPASNAIIVLWLYFYIVPLISVIHSCNIVNRQVTFYI